MQIITKPLVLLGLALFASPAIASEGWIADFDQAVKIAKEQKKDLLVDFTGSDWCGYCIKLDKEVFAHEVFTASVTADYVLVALDFPKSTEAKAKVPDAGRNQEIARKYGISGYPSVLLMTPDGVVFGRTGYRKGGADAYVEHLTELRSTGRRDLEVTLKVLATFNAAEGAAKTEALGELLKAFEGLAEDSPFAKTLFAAAQSAITLDPKNEHGLKLRAIRTLSMAGAHNAELLTAAFEVDGTNAQGVLELAVMAQFQKVGDEPTAKAALKSLDTLNQFAFSNKESGFLLNFTAATWAAGPMSDAEATKTYVARALKTGHEDEERIAHLKQLIEGK